MGCLTHEQMLLEALGLEQDAKARDHLQTCRSCREQVDAYRTLPERLVGTLCRGEAEHESARQRLMAALPDPDLQGPIGSSAEVESSSYSLARLGGFVMRHRFACGGTIVASVGMLLAWILLSPNPISAMEQTAEAIREVKSYQFDVVAQPPQVGAGPVKMTMYQQEGRFREDTFFDGELHSVSVFSPQGPGLVIRPRAKTYHRTRARKGEPPPLIMVTGLGQFSGEADEDLGSKLIGRIEAQGFRIAAEKVDPNLIGDGVLTVWVDPDSKLPVLIELKHPLWGVLRMENFQWDVSLEPELFDPQPPADYKELTPPAPDPDQQAAAITAGLKIYAEAFDGRYPPVEKIYGDLISASLSRKLGLPDPIFGDPASAKKLREHEAYPRYREASRGIAEINGIQRENPDSAFFGKTVGPDDAEKLLFYWKLDDGSYRVIFGDLKSETATAARLGGLLESR